MSALEDFINDSGMFILMGFFDRIMRCFFLLVAIQIGLMTNSKGQSKPLCKCSYFSNYEIERFFYDADSIYTLLARKHNKRNIMVVGARGHSAANLMFIVNLDGKNKGFYYDLIERRNRVYKGFELDNLVKDLVRDSSLLHTAKYDPNRVDHDAGFFVSFNYSQSRLTEICGSQLIGYSKRPLALAIRNYIADFKTK